MAKKTAVIAIGGNSLIKDDKHVSVEFQYEAAKETCYHIADLIQEGYEEAIRHGNAPKVRFILSRSELSARQGMH
jgi:carbamate kinase